MPPARMMPDQEYLSLPVFGVLGGYFGGGKNTFDKEAVRRNKVDAVLSLTLSAMDEVEARTAEELQAELGIPVLVYDGCLDRTGEVLRRVGALAGVPDRGNLLADYFDVQILRHPEHPWPRFRVPSGVRSITPSRPPGCLRSRVNPATARSSTLPAA